MPPSPQPWYRLAQLPRTRSLATRGWRRAAWWPAQFCKSHAQPGPWVPQRVATVAAPIRAHGRGADSWGPGHCWKRVPWSLLGHIPARGLCGPRVIWAALPQAIWILNQEGPVALPTAEGSSRAQGPPRSAAGVEDRGVAGLWVEPGHSCPSLSKASAPSSKPQAQCVAPTATAM